MQPLCGKCFAFIRNTACKSPILERGNVKLFSQGKLVILEDQLNSFDALERWAALESLQSAVQSGDIDIPSIKHEVNLHFHTFFSFNANSWSPSRIAWESVKYGLEVSGIVDFDILDGMEEFIAAGELLGLKTTVGLESRVFIAELDEHVISSPNEPGIAYFMATGCFMRPDPGSEAEAILGSMAGTARVRNLAMLSKVNPYLQTVQLDYDTDAIPLAPSGNVTERHLLTALDQKARKVFSGDRERLAAFWVEKLDVPRSEIRTLMDDTPRFHEKMRARLMKFGGIGYVAPNSDSFPSIENAIKMMLGMESLPTATWLDGTNPGEADSSAFLGLLASKGVVALNIIPDRNWNIKNAEEKAVKTRKLAEIIAEARQLEMPIAVGTEMNKAGLPFVDDFSAAELRPYIQDFIDGARCLYGHTLLARYADFGWFSKAADSAFGGDTRAKRLFYTKVGVSRPTAEIRERLRSLRGNADPGDILNAIK